MLRRTVHISMAACVVALMVGGLSVAQQGGPGGAGPGVFDPTRMRQMMTEMMRERLGVKDDTEWKVIEPRLRKLTELNQQMQMSRMQGIFGMLAMFGGGRGGPGGGNDGRPTPPMPGFGPSGEMSALDKAMSQLRTILTNQSAAPDDIKKALTAVRAAGLRMQEDRAAAQVDLKKILTLRQEATLVEMGQLD